MLTLVIVVILAALVFEFINGFHDTANSIATVVATKVLSPGKAVMLAAFMNLLGAFWGTAVAKTIASGLIDTEVVNVTSQVILCALLGGITWNLITWWFGLPSSSSHALIGGLCGAALAAADNNFAALIWSKLGAEGWTSNKGLLWKVVIPMVSSPIAGFTLGVAILGLLYGSIKLLSKLGGALGRLARPRWVNAIFGKLQLVSAGYMGFAHGTNDAQKTMGIIALTIFAAESAGTLDNLPTWAAFLHPGGDKNEIDTWIVVTCAVVMAAGTAMGGWRIIKTLGHKMVKLHPIDGFAAETASATILVGAAHFGMPVSTTHSISTAIMGVGFGKNPRKLKFTVIERILWAWVLTIPAAGGVAYALLRLFEALGWA